MDFMASAVQLAGEKVYEVGRYSTPNQVLFEEGSIHSHMYVQLFIFQEVFESGRAGSAHTIKTLLLPLLKICTTGQTSYTRSWDIKSLDLELQLTASPKILG